MWKKYGQWGRHAQKNNAVNWLRISPIVIKVMAETRPIRTLFVINEVA